MKTAKKYLVALILLAIASAAFAQGVKLGFGVTYSPESYVITTSTDGDTGTALTSSSFIGVRAIIDATFVEASVGYSSFLAGTGYKDYSGLLPDTSAYEPGTNVNWTYIPIAIMLKYPFRVARNTTVFPLLGAEYDINLTYTDNQSGEDKSDMGDDQVSGLNHFYLKAGFGADIPISRSVFIRPEILFAYKIPSNYDNDTINALQDPSIGGVDSATVDTYKFEFSVAIMFKTDDQERHREYQSENESNE